MVRGQVKLDYIFELGDWEALAHLLVGMMQRMQVRRLVVSTASVYLRVDQFLRFTLLHPWNRP